MRRSVSLSILAVALLGAVACDGPYLPAGWNAPIVTSVTVSPDPVVAGAPFTVTVTATDDHRVASVGLRFLGPHPVRWEHMRVPCQSPTFDPLLAVTAVFNCTMPTIAPNGTWTMAVTVCDGEVQCQEYGGLGGGGYATKTFGVTGGTDDDRPPAVVSAVFAPDPIVVGSPFNVTLQVSDDHLESGLPAQILTFSGLGTGTSTQYCPESARTGLSATIDQFVFACPAPPLAGQYSLGNGFTDQIGNHYLWNPVITIGSPS